jgi:hypothetical protein
MTRVARLEDAATGAGTDLGVPWPAKFDVSGTFIYSPAWNEDPKAGPATTTIIDAAHGALIAHLSGAAPRSFLYEGATAVGLLNGGYLAVLQGSVDCAGSAIYVQGAAAPQCISSGVDVRIAPDGSRVAVAKDMGAVGPVRGPAFEGYATRFAIDVVTVGAASVTVVGDAVSFQSPLMVWDATSRYLLVLWPHAGGIGP